MASQTHRFLLAASAVAALLGASLQSAAAADQRQIARGKYLTTVMGCTDCHTPGSFLGHPDMTKYLGGSDVGFAIPGMGVFVGANLTPDKETGLGKWTTQQIVTAFTTGRTPQGRMLAPIMPYDDFKSLTKADALAIAAYLQSLPPVSHAVPGPFGPSETPTTFVMTVVPGNVYASMPKPPGPPAGAGGPPPGAPPAQH
ncbi:MAG TPA: c-type cytochrome [Stellaceae bacterium]|nr:c-type cytochrome [Stellaceae bacterium]